MADNTTLDPGTGGDVIATDDIGGVKHQRVKIEFGADGSATDVSTANPLPISDAGGSLTVDGTVTANLAAGTNNIGDVDVLTMPATAADGGTQPSTTVVVSGNDGTNVQTLKTDVNGVLQVAQNGSVTVADGGGSLTVDGTVTANAGTGTFAVSAASLPLPSGAATAAKQPALGTAGTAASDVITVQGIASMTALKVDGSAVTQPVSDGGGSLTVDGTVGVSGTVAVTDNSGSLTVDAPVGTPVFVTATPSATGGWSKTKYAAQTTNVQTVKGSAGTFGGYYVYNPNTSVAYVQVFDVSGTVTLGTTSPDLVYGIPASSGANVEITNGVNFANAIKLACTTTATGSTAPGTGLDISIYYK